MRIPIFEEIIPPNFEGPTLRKLLEKSRIGRAPCYLSLLELSPRDAKLYAERIANILEEKKISARFPYPFFLLTEESLQVPSIRCVSSKDDLPSYYIRKIKKLNSKELALLNKVFLLNEKVSNLPLYKHQIAIKERAAAQSELYDLVKEKSFYDRVSDNL